MTGLLRAEWLRFTRRRAVWAIGIGVLLLSGVLFLFGYNGTRGVNPVFDEAASRDQAMATLAGQNLPPDQLAKAVDEFVAQDRQMYDQIAATYRHEQMRYAFPESVATAVGATGFVDFALILMAAIMLGDEFSAGTIRTFLVVVGDRRRILLARLIALGAVAVLLVGGLAALAVILPLLLGALGSAPPAPTDFDPSVIPRLVAGAVLSAFAVIAFATLVTAVLRSGALTLVVALVYVLVELAAVDAVTRIAGFRPGDSFEAVTRLLPLRSVVTLLSGPDAAASEAPWLPLAFVVVIAWGLVFAALAVVRFGRMDIVE